MSSQRDEEHEDSIKMLSALNKLYELMQEEAGIDKRNGESEKPKLLKKTKASTFTIEKSEKDQ